MPAPCLFVSLLALVSAAGALPLVPVGGVQRCGDPAALAIELDSGSGAWVALHWQGRLVASDSPASTPFDLQQDERWLVGSRQVAFRLAALAQPTPNTLAATYRGGDWEVRCDYRLDPPRARVERALTLTWRGAAGTKLRGLWLRNPEFRVAPGGGYFFPGWYPPQRFAVEAFRPQQKRTSSRSLAPAVVDLGDGRSALFLNNELAAGADRGGVSVTELAGGLWVGQSFQAQGHLRPGQPQVVGDACLLLVAGEGDAALRAIHGWQADHGLTVPADRPAWFADAAIYALHPGGSIGSGFRDLGGFAAATDFLPTVAATGCNTIWLLPVEDASPYWPRDYYRFQDGLGTPQQFRELVAQAHRLHLQVLQDIVPHGGSNTYPRAQEHPEWLAQEEDGSTLFYWCFDFNWPGWRDYMAGVARHYVQQYGVDGYRVDACGGSKIPNWNPQIPYDRASQALLQGGLSMLRGLRQTVRTAQPATGGLLAEVQGSVYGAVSDAVYDFDLCYNVQHDLRRQPAEVFVTRLRRWLHEQQYAEPADLLRLRHSESHDSLRVRGWCGPRGERALFALSAFIQGLPMVFQGQEQGAQEAIRSILDQRTAIPALRRGTPDYLAVDAPPGVFACLRTLGDEVAVALVDFRPEPAAGALRVPRAALPAALRDGLVASPWRGARVTLPPRDGWYELPWPAGPQPEGVILLRRTAATPPAPEKGPDPFGAEKGPDPFGVLVRGGEVVVGIDPASGLPRGGVYRGRAWVGAGDLYLPPALVALAGPAEVRREGAAVVAERPFGAARLTLRYEPVPAGVALTLGWAGAAPEYGGLWLPTAAVEWRAAGQTGRRSPRRGDPAGYPGNIYWRRQGSAVVWDSLLAVGPAGPQALSLSSAGDGPALLLKVDAARAQLVQQSGDAAALGVLLAWRDPNLPPAAQRDGLRVVLGEAAEPAPDAWCETVAGYRLTLPGAVLDIGRSGALLRLYRRTASGELTLVAQQQELYTDFGFSADRERYSNAAEVEASAVRVGPREVTFEGRLRGSGRFDLLAQPIDYHLTYAWGAGSTFRLTAGVRPTAAARQGGAFLAQLLLLPAMTTWQASAGDTVLATGAVGDGQQRTGETKRLVAGRVPDRLVCRTADQVLLTVSDLQHTGAPPANVFSHGQQLFWAWCDGPDGALPPGQWATVSALWTVGPASPTAVGRPSIPTPPPAATAAPLRDGDFEGAGAVRPWALLAQQPWPVEVVAPTGQAWTLPSGARLVTEPHRSGRLAVAITGSGAYEMVRQPLDLSLLPPGSRWRFSAWVKGANLQPGDVGWKVGCLRFGALSDQMRYTTSEALLGTFDWRPVSVDLTVPAGLQSLSAEFGINGATGQLWVDGAKLERLP
ncbi:MAG: hypothetical protein IT204_03650 [Fimbriimonadaceae bacterium]|nr:hypothetical protein [Fimbriimonadaceae bacterium]